MAKITLQQFADRMGQWPAQSQRELLASMRVLRDRIYILAVRNARARRKTGKMAASIRPTGPRQVGSGYVVGVTAGNASVRYAAIQERGGTIRHPGASGKLQVFEVRGRTVFTMHTRPHNIRIPARPYMLPAVKQAIRETDMARAYLNRFRGYVFA